MTSLRRMGLAERSGTRSCVRLTGTSAASSGKRSAASATVCLVSRLLVGLVVVLASSTGGGEGLGGVLSLGAVEARAEGWFEAQAQAEARADAQAESAPHGVVQALQNARQAFESENYDESLAEYRALLDAGWVSAGLYYNLGCAAYRAGELGWAVAYFEEARRLSPRDGDIRHNLRQVRSRLQDRLPDQRPSWLLGAMAGVLDAFAPADLVRWALGAFWIFTLLVAAQWLGPRSWRPALRRALRGLLLVAAVLVAALALKLYQIQTAPSGVVVAEEVQVLTGPREGETVQFVLHAGAMLHLGRETGEWREAYLGEDMRGWVPKAKVTELHGSRWRP